jgi:hypothetical protein
MSSRSKARRGCLALGLVLALLAASVASAAEPTPPVTRASIPRPVLREWLARGPQYLLSQVVPTPLMDQGKFRGYRLNLWFPEHPEVVQGAVRLGDVVTRINGRSIERPDQYLYIWKTLESAAAIDLDLVRDGRPLRVSFDLPEPPAPPAQEQPGQAPAPRDPPGTPATPSTPGAPKAGANP